MTVKGAIYLFILLTGNVVISNFSLAKVRHRDGLEREALIAELTGRPVKKENDRSLFVEVLRGYQSDNWGLMQRNVQTLMTLHSKSSLADNALYLAGLYQFHRRQYGDAIQYFNRVIKEYPHSEKAVSASFAKGMTYKTMGLGELARTNLKQVLYRYPGSPESLRANLELRLIK